MWLDTFMKIFGLVRVKPDEPVVENAWLTFAKRIEMHPSWRYASLRTPGSKPLAIVAHYTATDPGTAISMAKRRTKPRTKDDRAASWHLSIEADGTVVQMAPLTVGCWHAGSNTAKKIPGVGWANRTAIGVELVGYGKEFPPAQVEAACRVWRAIVREYSIPREHAMITHQSIDPTRKADPGRVWMGEHAPRVLDAAYQAAPGDLLP